MHSLNLPKKRFLLTSAKYQNRYNSITIYRNKLKFGTEIAFSENIFKKSADVNFYQQISFFPKNAHVINCLQIFFEINSINICERVLILC